MSTNLFRIVFVDKNTKETSKVLPKLRFKQSKFSDSTVKDALNEIDGIFREDWASAFESRYGTNIPVSTSDEAGPCSVEDIAKQVYNIIYNI